MLQRRATVLFPLILLIILVVNYWPKPRTSSESTADNPFTPDPFYDKEETDSHDDFLDPEFQRPGKPSRPYDANSFPDSDGVAYAYGQSDDEIPEATSTVPSDSSSPIPSSTSASAESSTTSGDRPHLPGADDMVDPTNLPNSEATTTPPIDSLHPSATELPDVYKDPLLTRVLPNIPEGTVKPMKIDKPLEFAPPVPGAYSTHPIDELIRKGKTQYRNMKTRRSTTIEEAAEAYRKKRNRHPPPGFDDWFLYAKSKGSIIIEDFFDQIYHDIEPFWAINPKLLRETAKTWHMKVTIRNGTARWHSGQEAEGSWLFDWHNMIQYVEAYLPDVDLAFNNIDESRILVPWEKVNDYVEEASKHRNLAPPEELISEYQSLDALPDGFPEPKAHEWEDWHNGTDHWEFARMACPPDSEARDSHLDKNMSIPPYYPSPSKFPPNTFHGYVSNWTKTRSACSNPDLRNIHGNFVHPRWVSVNTTLFPLLGGSKIQGMNNEIIVPAAKYWSTEVLYSGHPDVASSRWSEKHTKAIWRGGATGGKHNDTNWRRFQRQRFISMMNGTQVGLTEEKLANLTKAQIDSPSTNITAIEPALPHNFPFPTFKTYPLQAAKTKPSTLADWVSSLNDGAFVHFMCHPQVLSQFSNGTECGYLEPYYEPGDAVEMPEQFAHKYLPDIDGNSYSGRWRAFLRSGSVPLKATIYTEWHDARLVPWVHFVPMDNSFADYFGILEYFAGFDGPSLGQHSTVHVEGRDEAAREIAEEGRSWANKVLRHEDMLVYMHRLVLEYARVTNDGRDKLGWAGDLLKNEEDDEADEELARSNDDDRTSTTSSSPTSISTSASPSSSSASTSPSSPDNPSEDEENTNEDPDTTLYKPQTPHRRPQPGSSADLLEKEQEMNRLHHSEGGSRAPPRSGPDRASGFEVGSGPSGDSSSSYDSSSSSYSSEDSLGDTGEGRPRIPHDPAIAGSAEEKLREAERLRAMAWEEERG